MILVRMLLELMNNYETIFNLQYTSTSCSRSSNNIFTNITMKHLTTFFIILGTIAVTWFTLYQMNILMEECESNGKTVDIMPRGRGSSYVCK